MSIKEQISELRDDMGLVRMAAVMGTAFGVGFGCTFGAFYFAAKLFVAVAGRIFG